MHAALICAQADLSAVSFDSSRARLSFRVARPLEHFVKHYDHVRPPTPPSPPRRLTVVLHSQTSDASCLCFELADAKDRLKFKTRVAPLMTNCAVS